MLRTTTIPRIFIKNMVITILVIHWCVWGGKPLKHIHKRHPIARYEVSFVNQHLIDILSQSLQLFKQYLTILDRVITKLDPGHNFCIRVVFCEKNRSFYYKKKTSNRRPIAHHGQLYWGIFCELFRWYVCTTYFLISPLYDRFGHTKSRNNETKLP